MKRTAVPSILVAMMSLALGVTAEAQQAKKVPRIGYLGLSDPSSPAFQSFQKGVREVGYIEGQNVLMESRFAFGNEWRLDALAAEIVGLNVNAIVAQSSPALFAARGMTKTIPIVMNYVGDPVAAGLAATLERPGRNVTGIGGLAAGLGGKWLEILKETVPELRRVGVLYFGNPDQSYRNPARVYPRTKELEIVARSLQVELQSGEIEARPSLSVFMRHIGKGVGSAFTRATSGQADALIVLPGPVLDENLDHIADLAIKRRLPSIFWQATFPEAGGLLAYGANEIEQFRRVAYVVDKILKGAKPAELPVEQPKKFELVINLQTANQIGLTVPPNMLARADRVIK